MVADKIPSQKWDAVSPDPIGDIKRFMDEIKENAGKPREPFKLQTIFKCYYCGQFLSVNTELVFPSIITASLNMPNILECPECGGRHRIHHGEEEKIHIVTTINFTIP